MEGRDKQGHEWVCSCKGEDKEISTFPLVTIHLNKPSLR